ncbi:hypothetical protein BOTCAL_2442g00010 [Botryotinia calthae]|uniref:Uncharacterized protein n=1 Tax=Botryotinia calthae TaxID=38488 RepID=A0A4Y8C939_9HELO|nr:hypothetical protein BOTCAL_2442g00010 [Botryotinia calthae]
MIYSEIPSAPILQNKKEQLQTYEPRIIRKKKMNKRRRSSSTIVDKSGSDSDSNQNSGYNSQSDQGFGTDAEASYYQQIMYELEAEGTTLSNPNDETKAIIEEELER